MSKRDSHVPSKVQALIIMALFKKNKLQINIHNIHIITNNIITRRIHHLKKISSNVSSIAEGLFM